MTSESDFQAMLDATPDDWQTRLIFADWLQERGDPRAEGYRALGMGLFNPDHYSRINSADGDEAFCYWEGRGGPCTRTRLPSDWFHLLRGFRTRDPEVRTFRNYGTRAACDDAAAIAFAKLPQHRRLELLRVTPVEAA